MLTLEELQSYQSQVTAWRRHLHQYPELGFNEYQTAEFIQHKLTEWDIPYQADIARTGVVGLIKGDYDGPTILLRADMDALPIQEENDVPYASKNPGIMHACGHDGHVAILLLVSLILKQNQSQIRGTVKLVFQPAEEGPGGAKPMIEQGVLEEPKVDYAIGLHLWGQAQPGTVLVNSGPMMGAADSFTIHWKGQGTHAAMPASGTDLIAIIASFINTIYTLSPRTIEPFTSGLISFTAIQAGNTHNVLPSTAELKGTIRALEPHTRATLKTLLQSQVAHIANQFNIDVTMTYQDGYPPLVNNPQVTELLTKELAQLPLTQELIQDGRTLGGEDMAYFLQQVPGCFFYVGAAPEQAYPHHHPKFDIQEEALIHAASCLLASVKALGSVDI